MNNCRIRRTGTLACLGVRDGQACPSYSPFPTVISRPILSRIGKLEAMITTAANASIEA